MINRIIRFFLENKLVTLLFFLLVLGWGLATAPFNWDLGSFPRDPVPVDAIPDIGENQQQHQNNCSNEHLEPAAP